MNRSQVWGNSPQASYLILSFAQASSRCLYCCRENGSIRCEKINKWYTKDSLNTMNPIEPHINAHLLVPLFYLGIWKKKPKKPRHLNWECICVFVQISDLQDDNEESQRNIQQLKKKTQRLTAELQDTKLHLEGQQSRNHDLEKKQRKSVNTRTPIRAVPGQVFVTFHTGDPLFCLVTRKPVVLL